MLQDLRYALRTLRKSPAFATAAILTIAIGIGASTAVFSVVDAALLRPLPYRDQERVLDVSNTWNGTPRAALSPAEYFDYHASVGTAFTAFGVYAVGATILTGSGDPVRLRTAYASAEVLPALGAMPAAGRAFTAEEDRDRRSVALISDGLWSRRFGADPAVVGRQIVLDGTGTEVIGVLPPDFRLPDDYAAGQVTDVVAPLGLDPAAVAARGSHFLRGVARLAPGVSVRRAQTALAAIATRFVAEFPADYPRDMRFAVATAPLAERVIGDARRPLLLLLGAAGFVLLVACANVAGLMLVRLDARRTELAVRAAVGAGPSRIVRQLLAESVTIGALGGLAGVSLAWGSTRALLALQPPNLPRFGEASLDVTVLAFATALAIGTGVLFGLPRVPGLGAAVGALPTGWRTRLQRGAQPLPAGARGGPDGHRADAAGGCGSPWPHAHGAAGGGSRLPRGSRPDRPADAAGSRLPDRGRRDRRVPGDPRSRGGAARRAGGRRGEQPPARLQPGRPQLQDRGPRAGRRRGVTPGGLAGGDPRVLRGHGPHPTARMRPVRW
jgi:predicted permease